MTFELVPCGLDFGNGMIKIWLNGKVSKIPNCYGVAMPKGQLTSSGLTSKPKAFGLQVGNENLYFGQDTLSLQTYRKIDEWKYKPEYISRLFKAVLYHWLQQHHMKDFLADKRLKIVCGMPPEKYEDRSYRAMAEKAYKAVFQANRPSYIRPLKGNTLSYFTSFERVAPETLSLRANNKSGYTLRIDIGYGTMDICLFHSAKGDKPIQTRSMNNGLMHAYENVNQAELDILRRLTKPEMYLNSLELKIIAVARQLIEQGDLHIIIIGGGANLLDNEFKSDIKKLSSSVVFGDEFSNVRAFGELTNG